MIAIVDSSALYAVLDSSDRDHRACLAVLERSDVDFVIPALVVDEVCYLLGSRLGPAVEELFLRSLSESEVESPASNEWALIADYVQR